MSGEPEKILRRRTADTAQIPMETEPSASPEDYAADAKVLAPASRDEPGDNSRVLQLASIAQYRAKRRIAIAEKTRCGEQLEPAFPTRKS